MHSNAARPATRVASYSHCLLTVSHYDSPQEVCFESSSSSLSSCCCLSGAASSTVGRVSSPQPCRTELQQIPRQYHIPRVQDKVLKIGRFLFLKKEKSKDSNVHEICNKWNDGGIFPTSDAEVVAAAPPPASGRVDSRVSGDRSGATLYLHQKRELISWKKQKRNAPLFQKKRSRREEEVDKQTHALTTGKSCVWG